MKFTIDRSKWLRGEGAEASRLLRRSDGKQCCLGFYLEACGVKRAFLMEQAAPKGLSVPLPAAAAWLLKTPRMEHSAECAELMQENDDVMPPPVREEIIARLFKRENIEVVFVDQVTANE